MQHPEEHHAVVSFVGDDLQPEYATETFSLWVDTSQARDTWVANIGIQDW